MIIRPGYDFTVNEIPDRAKFIIQAQLTTFTQVDATRVGSSLLGRMEIVSDSGSNATMPSSTGGLWLDSQGNLWGKTSAGIVIVRRATGGMETLRCVHSQQGPAILQAGYPVEPAASSLGADHFSTAIQAMPNRYPHCVLGYLANTSASIAGSQRQRVVLRGFTPISYGYSGIASDATAGHFNVWTIPTMTSDPLQTLSMRKDGRRLLGGWPYRQESLGELVSVLGGDTATLGSGMTTGLAFMYPFVMGNS